MLTTARHSIEYPYRANHSIKDSTQFLNTSDNALLIYFLSKENRVKFQ